MTRFPILLAALLLTAALPAAAQTGGLPPPRPIPTVPPAIVLGDPVAPTSPGASLRLQNLENDLTLRQLRGQGQPGLGVANQQLRIQQELNRLNLQSRPSDPLFPD